MGKPVTHKHIDKLVDLNNQLGINIAGEGGEFETLVLNSPMFKKRLAIDKQSVVEENQHTARFVVEKAHLS